MTTNTTPASQFRVERAGPFEVRSHDRGWIVLSETWGWLHRDCFFIDYPNKGNWELLQSWKVVCEQIYFPTEAEARYRLLLAMNPREAIAAFYDWLGEDEYIGECNDCWGRGMQGWTSSPCPTCQGTGGPPSAETLSIAADWMEERGMSEAEWVRSVAEGGGK